MPRSKEDLILQLSSEYMIAYDNLDSIKPDFNDIFCQVATGGSSVKRKLYTDTGLSVFSYKRCLILNGINYISAKPDLLDRSIVIHLKTIKNIQRKTEFDIFSDFNKKIPYFLHHIFTIISNAKLLYKSIELKSLPRMADAVKWGCAIAESMGVSKEKFLDVYSRNRDEINSELISDNPLVMCIQRLLEKKETWKSSYDNLWNELNKISIYHTINKSDRKWPNSPSSLSRRLNELKVNLEHIGIFFDTRNTGAYNEITLYKKSKNNSNIE
jgi:hypothetical protein